MISLSTRMEFSERNFFLAQLSRGDDKLLPAIEIASGVHMSAWCRLHH